MSCSRQYFYWALYWLWDSMRRWPSLNNLHVLDMNTPISGHQACNLDAPKSRILLIYPKTKIAAPIVKYFLLR